MTDERYFAKPSSRALTHQTEQLFVVRCQSTMDAFPMERQNQRLMVAFASVLREERLNAGLTQEGLAEAADLSSRHISFLETGGRQPSLTILMAISTGLGVSVADLMAKTETAYLGDNEKKTEAM